MSDDFLRELLPQFWTSEPDTQNQEASEKEANERLRLLALQASRSDNPFEVLKSVMDPPLPRSENVASTSSAHAPITTTNSSAQSIYFSTPSTGTTPNSLPYPHSYDEYTLPSGSTSIPQAATATAASNAYFEGLGASSSAVPHSQQPVPQDDKRRRNTLASARFRDRKKQRENELEGIVDRLRRQSESLEGEAINLRKENNWLLSLLELDGAKQALQQSSSGTGYESNNPK